ncbi:hypothetical protein IWX80_000532 [Flavobacterium sp. CAN_S2]|jgi:hypothetical protein
MLFLISILLEIKKPVEHVTQVFNQLRLLNLTYPKIN